MGAAWISLVFKLEVYRAVKETRSEKETALGSIMAPAGTSLSSLVRKAMEAAEEKERRKSNWLRPNPVSLSQRPSRYGKARRSTERRAGGQAIPLCQDLRH